MEFYTFSACQRGVVFVRMSDRFMEITYLGHSSFRLKGKNATVVTDPYESSMVGLKFPKITADIVTISHAHKDHSQSDSVKETKMVISEPGEYEVMGVSIIGFKTFHDDKKGEERGGNTIYLYEIDDLRLAHLGDLGHKLPEDIIEDLGTLDILMLPVGGVYTIDAKVASEIVRSIEPAVVIPMHYKQTGMNMETFGKISEVEDFLKEVGLPVEETDKFSLKKGETLEGESKVVVLKPKLQA